MVRSGVLVSVHSFAADPGRGFFILASLAVVIGGSLALYVWRAPLLHSTAGFDLVSRESFLLFNNILLVVATAVVFGGTLGPFIADLIGHETISVGPPYYNSMFLIPMLPLFALVSVGTFARWKRGQLGESRRRLIGTFVFALVLGLAIIMGIYGDRSVLGPVGVVLGLWILITALVDPVDRLRRRLSLSAAVVGMTLAHMGLGVMVLGITAMESDRIQEDVSLAPGQEAVLGRYSFRLESIEEVEGPNYSATQARVAVMRDGEPETVLFPQLRHYHVAQKTLAEAALGVSWRRDLLATLGEDLGAGAWSLRLQVRPLMSFVWLGSFFMAVGGLLATLDRRYRRRREVAQAQPASSPDPRAAESASGGAA
jgi:cytochrome c-type biogenesis protein CcmF